jgi:ribosomal protein S18 acetylase RimI-like enzyme
VLRLSSWPYDPTVALITVTDHDLDIDQDALRASVDGAIQGGARLVRTGALTHSSGLTATALGFRVIDELLLLERPLDRQSPRRSGVRIAPLRHRHLDAAAMVDLAAFGPRWTHDAPALAEAMSATPVAHGVRSVERGRRVTGFAISGVSGSTGYLQRLAVEPTRRRRGVARALVADALWWMARRHADRALVNTSITNEPAIALYVAAGFTVSDERLVVAEFDPERDRP